MKYFTCFWFGGGGGGGVEIHKIREIFFQPASNKFVIQNNPLMQLR